MRPRCYLFIKLNYELLRPSTRSPRQHIISPLHLAPGLPSEEIGGYFREHRATTHARTITNPTREIYFFELSISSYTLAIKLHYIHSISQAKTTTRRCSEGRKSVRKLTANKKSNFEFLSEHPMFAMEVGRLHVHKHGCIYRPNAPKSKPSEGQLSRRDTKFPQLLYNACRRLSGDFSVDLNTSRELFLQTRDIRVYGFQSFDFLDWLMIGWFVAVITCFCCVDSVEPLLLRDCYWFRSVLPQAHTAWNENQRREKKQTWIHYWLTKQ